jgi:murein DD-endopeptidase MepM/ murein hydrolase activator NlpD
MGLDETPLLQFPLRGAWLVLNPPGHPRFAYDISALGPDGRLAKVSWWRVATGQARAQDVVGWGREVFAPVGGRVVQAVNDVPDRIRLNPIVDVPASMIIRPARARGNLAMLAGNHVVIGFDELFAVLAHMQRGSVRVTEGDVVTVGEQLGVVGNAGNSLAPHLHFHVMDGSDFAKATVLPFRVQAYERWLDQHWVPMRNEPPPLRWGRVRVADTLAP